MNDRGQPTHAPSILPLRRASGLLLHITSLPSPYGIGDLGPEALAWIDRLADSGQSWWQVLPLAPTGYGDSPYSAASSFAGNWLLISPDLLIADGWLQPADVADCSFPTTTVDFHAVRLFKERLLTIVFDNFKNGAGPAWRRAWADYCREQAHWLDDYALFAVLKEKYSPASYLEWPEALVRRDPEALARTRRELASEIDLVRLAQFLVFHQARQLKEYAHRRGVGLIGDLPFFVATESSDVWANPELFLLDEQLQPRFVAGVPPDYFSVDGQLWGTPVYDWEALRRTNYRWCIARIQALLAHVDLIRLDHFRGFAGAWLVPAESPTARSGHWSPGPGADCLNALHDALGGLPFVAEDLGHITPDVHALRDQFHLLGTARPAIRLRRPTRQPAFSRQHHSRDRRVHRDTRQQHDARLVCGAARGSATALATSFAGIRS